MRLLLDLVGFLALLLLLFVVVFGMLLLWAAVTQDTEVDERDPEQVDQEGARD
jgi:uncharacterized Tic20 family protein